MGVDVAAFERATPLPQGRTVLAIGRLVEKKGFDVLVDALAQLPDVTPADRRRRAAARAARGAGAALRRARRAARQPRAGRRAGRARGAPTCWRCRASSRATATATRCRSSSRRRWRWGCRRRQRRGRAARVRARPVGVPAPPGDADALAGCSCARRCALGPAARRRPGRRRARGCRRTPTSTPRRADGEVIEGRPRAGWGARRRTSTRRRGLSAIVRQPALIAQRCSGVSSGG